MTDDPVPYDPANSVDDVAGTFVSGELPVAVYGLGKMGLPLAAVYADVSGNTIGVDVDPTVVAAVEDGSCPVKREPGLDELVDEVVGDGRLTATTDYEAATTAARVHVVIVPTPITDAKAPDLSILEETVGRIGVNLSAGDLVVVECTVPPKTCRDVVEPALAAESGLSTDEFGVAMCPERTSSGRALRDIRGAYPKVIGGTDAESTVAARGIYREITSNEVLACSDATVAETVKVFEGVYRDVNIALANELAKLTDELGVSVNEAIAVANTTPYSDIHTPGAGVGGHCIPYYPYFLIEGFETDNPLLQTARAVNDSMPRFTVQRVHEGLTAVRGGVEGATVVVLGLTYRPGVEETRATPARPIASELEAAGVEVLTVDPLLDDASSFAGESVPLEEAYERAVDGVVVVTPHEDFDELDWDRLRGDRDRLAVVDGRQAYDLADGPDWTYTVGGRSPE